MYPHLTKDHQSDKPVYACPMPTHVITSTTTSQNLHQQAQNLGLNDLQSSVSSKIKDVRSTPGCSTSIIQSVLNRRTNSHKIRIGWYASNTIVADACFFMGLHISTEQRIKHHRSQRQSDVLDAVTKFASTASSAEQFRLWAYERFTPWVSNIIVCRSQMMRVRAHILDTRLTE